jgi:hypothetical protein
MPIPFNTESMIPAAMTDPAWPPVLAHRMHEQKVLLIEFLSFASVTTGS